VQITIAKHANGKGVLKCRRSDGTESWQRQAERHALHFVHHDITHFVTEFTLGLKQAFFGLVASGWDIEDTTGLSPRGPLPDEAVFAEHLVGLLDVERATIDRWDAGYFIEQLEAAGVRIPVTVRALLSDATLDVIRAKRVSLSKQWNDLPPNGSLVLDFPDP
jgi:hypothetical protein